MDPLLDYYLVTKDDDTELWMAFGEDVEGLPGCERVRKIPFWQALQWKAALREVERALVEGDDLRSMLSAVFLGSTGGAIGTDLAPPHRERGMI